MALLGNDAGRENPLHLCSCPRDLRREFLCLLEELTSSLVATGASDGFGVMPPAVWGRDPGRSTALGLRGRARSPQQMFSVGRAQGQSRVGRAHGAPVHLLEGCYENLEPLELGTQDGFLLTTAKTTKWERSLRPGQGEGDLLPAHRNPAKHRASGQQVALTL